MKIKSVQNFPEKLLIVLTSFLLFLVGVSCGEESVYVPKPRMFPKINYPESSRISQFDTTICNFTFQYHDYNVIKRDSFKFDNKSSSNCWFDINVPSLNSSLHCSYYPISENATLDQLINDAFSLAGKHNVKANFRKESLIQNENGVKGILFEIEGPVASPVQFYLSDSLNHFFRASLYFNSTVNPDSTAEILKFLRKDIDLIIESFRWKK
jgi:gliding motility-associated lipoprotein GldD